MPDRDWIVIRRVTVAECPWLPRDVEVGERLYPYRGCTYGVIAEGVPVTMNGAAPFYEFPNDAVVAD